jgi:hypothetical protein
MLVLDAEDPTSITIKTVIIWWKTFYYQV